MRHEMEERKRKRMESEVWKLRDKISGKRVKQFDLILCFNCKTFSYESSRKRLCILVSKFNKKSFELTLTSTSRVS